jgi:hypothetical protein
VGRDLVTAPARFTAVRLSPSTESSLVLLVFGLPLQQGSCLAERLDKFLTEISMNTIKTLLVASAALVALSGACFADPAVTATDHEVLAQSYETRAAAAMEKAAAHEAMARAYRAGGTPKSNAQAMNVHCAQLVASYRAEAADYQAKAAAEHALATAK